MSARFPRADSPQRAAPYLAGPVHHDTPLQGACGRTRRKSCVEPRVVCAGEATRVLRSGAEVAFRASLRNPASRSAWLRFLYR